MNKHLHFIFFLLLKGKKFLLLNSQFWTNPNFKKNQIAIWFAVLFSASLGIPLSSSSHTIADPPEKVLKATPIPLTIMLLAETDIQTVYDGNTSVYIDSLPFGPLTYDVEPGDEVWYSGTGTLDDPNVGSYNRVLVFDQLTLNGKDKDKYTISYVHIAVMVSVIPKPLTVSLKPNTVISKVYDGSTNAPVTIDDLIFSGELANEEVNATALTAVYGDKNVGTEKNIIITNFTLSGANKNNYTLSTSSELKGSITPKPLSIFLLSESNISKVYDGSTSVYLDSLPFGPLTYDIEPGDEIWYSGTGTLDDPNVGSYNRLLVFDQLTLHGKDKDKYTINSVDLRIIVSIIPKPLTVSLKPNTVISKVYDGSTNAPVTTDDLIFYGGLANEEVNATALTTVYGDKNVGTEKNIIITNFTLSGADKNNYTLSTSSELKGNITPKPLSIFLLSESNISKIYDGRTDVVVDSIENEVPYKLPGDKIWMAGTGNFDNKNAGYNKTIIFDEIELKGPDKINYSVAESGVRLTGSIIPKTLLATFNNTNITKIYDGNTEAFINTANYNLPGIIIGDEVTINTELSSASYETKHVGSNKKIIATGLILSGLHASNYQLEQNSVEATIGIILPREITLTCLPQTKQYGSSDPELTYTVDGILDNDVLTGHLERSAGNDVGEYSISAGTLSGENYIFSTFTPSAFTITPAPLTITAKNKVRNQGEINPNFTFKYDGFVNGDTFSDLDSPPTAITAAASGSPAGDYDIEVAGATSGNYTITFVPGKLTVLPVVEEKQVRVSSTNRNAVQMNVYSDVPQRAAIILYSNNGQPMVVEQKYLGAGNNSYTLPVNNLSAGSYTLRVKAEKFNSAQNLNIK